MIGRIGTILLGAVLAIGLGGPVVAQSPEEVLQDLLRNGAVAEDFAPDFLAQVPVARVQAVLDQVMGLIGTPDVIQVSDGEFYIETLSHRTHGRIVVDDQGRISSLLFNAPEPIPQTMELALDALSKVAPDVSWLVLRDGQDLNARKADVAKPVASAFKLAVLSVLMQDITAGERQWDDVITLEARHKSLPSGQLQDMPDGAPLTIHTAATLMISISDNTATDLLIDLLGRERVAMALGLEHVLTTREFFALRLDPEAQARWLEAAPQERPALALEAAQSLPHLAEIPLHVPGLEWSVPARRLCGLIGPLADLPLMQVNPGLASEQDWARVAYKGGSEPGVLNYTTALLDELGREICVSVTFNSDGAIDELAAAAAYRGLLAVLR